MRSLSLNFRLRRASIAALLLASLALLSACATTPNRPPAVEYAQP